MKAVWMHEGRVLGAVLLLGALAVGALKMQLNAARVRLTAEDQSARAERQARAVPVVTLKLVARDLVDRLQLPGMVLATRQAVISAELPGTVLKRPVVEGTRVQDGDLLCQLDDQEFRIQLDAARADLHLAEADWQRSQALREKEILSAADDDKVRTQLELAKASVAAAELNVARCAIRAPFAGVVDRLFPELGERVNEGDRVAELLDTARVKVEVGIPEKDIQAVREVRTCAIRAGGAKYQGTRTFLSLAPTDTSLTYTYRLEVDNANGVLRPGMFAEADIVKSTQANGVAVPLFAVIPLDNGYAAFVVETGKDGKKIARKRLLTAGAILDREIEVRDGLQPGDELVVIGQRAVADGTPVEVTRSLASIREIAP